MREGVNLWSEVGSGDLLEKAKEDDDPFRKTLSLTSFTQLFIPVSSYQAHPDDNDEAAKLQNRRIENAGQLIFVIIPPVTTYTATNIRAPRQVILLLLPPSPPPLLSLLFQQTTENIQRSTLYYLIMINLSSFWKVDEAVEPSTICR